jgi:5-methylcytosine-specific restriction enzyme A
MDDSAEFMLGVARSPEWGRVRSEHLKAYPRCECCGGDDELVAHHIKPFHKFPELELDPSNLITLCEGSSSPNMNCHLIVGHCGNWSSWNEKVRSFARAFGRILRRRGGVKWPFE